MRKLETPWHNSPPSHPLNTATTTRPLGQMKQKQKSKLIPILIVCGAVLVSAVLVLASTGLSALLPANLFSPTSAAPARPVAALPQIVGHIYFTSSGQIREDSSQGIADQVELDLTNIPAPAAGKSYYAWLLSDDLVEGKSLLLGQLQVNHGTVQLHYQGDAQHTNLLGISSRILVTQEDTAIPPTVPSLDTSTWKYRAQIAQTPNPLDSVHHFGLLNHLRHLLSADPTLQELNMPGGLDIWLFRNVQKVLEWSGSARDDWATQDSALLHRHLIRILDYLDGLANVQNDVPLDSPVLVNPQIARVGLLEFDVQHQTPPGFLYHIGLHLHGLVQSPGVNAEQKRLAIQIDTAINKVEVLLQKVRMDAKKLVMMNNSQLLQSSSLSLLDDMVKQAQDAFVGQFNTQTGEIQDGITQIHYAIQRLATVDVTAINGTATKTTPDALFQLRSSMGGTFAGKRT